MSKELTRDSIVIGRELLVEEDGICAYIETWFDVDEKFGLHTADDPEQWVNFYAIYNPETDSLRCVYILSDGVHDDSEYEYIPTRNEMALIVEMVQSVCRKENHCGLLDLWREHNKSRGSSDAT